MTGRGRAFFLADLLNRVVFAEAGVGGDRSRGRPAPAADPNPGEGTMIVSKQGVRGWDLHPAVGDHCWDGETSQSALRFHPSL